MSGPASKNDVKTCLIDWLSVDDNTKWCFPTRSSKIAFRFASYAESLIGALSAAVKSSFAVEDAPSDAGNGRENSFATNSARVDESSNSALYIRCAIAFC